ncbi:MAG: FkbM family methyltransferase [bacterium]|nr:FkbM family methyltransferase [bacterium]
MVNNIFRNEYEFEDAKVLKSILKSTDVVLCIGGGIGFIATLSAKYAKKVSVVEANPDCIPTILNTASMNNVVLDIYEGILTKENGTSTFFITDDIWSSSLLYSKSQRGILCHHIKISAFQKEVNANVLVVDIEGGEYDLLKVWDFQSVERILVEFHPNLLSSSQLTEIIVHLTSEGFLLDFAVTDSIRHMLFKKEHNE